MDLELTDEQRWLSESIDTLLTREWTAPETVAQADVARRRRVWQELVDFGALSVGDSDGIGAVEACLIAYSLGRHLAATPLLASAALRLALAPFASELPADLGALLARGDAVALALLEPGGSWSITELRTEIRERAQGYALAGEKVAVEQLDLAAVLGVVGALDAEPALALVDAAAPGVLVASRASFDASLPMSAVSFVDVPVSASSVLVGVTARGALERLNTAGALLAAAEAVGAAQRILEDACRYAAERRQFGRRIAGFQALRHLLADMHVRCASGWSSVLYAAAAFDDDAEDALEAASVAKAYVSRAAREVAHGSMQVFGGIAFTEEHPAHRFLRRIIVREQQFGDAAHHERALGRALAQSALAPAGEPAGATSA
jgi:alkylation response protein AidB-like acyl-CoA dehydrogenase